MRLNVKVEWEVRYGTIRRKVRRLTRWKAMKDKRWSRTRQVADETEMSWRKIASENLYLIVAIGFVLQTQPGKSRKEREQCRHVGRRCHSFVIPFFGFFVYCLFLSFAENYVTSDWNSGVLLPAPVVS